MEEGKGRGRRGGQGEERERRERGVRGNGEGEERGGKGEGKGRGGGGGGEGEGEGKEKGRRGEREGGRERRCIHAWHALAIECNPSLARIWLHVHALSYIQRMASGMLARSPSSIRPPGYILSN